jgi:recombination protein RecT
MSMTNIMKRTENDGDTSIKQRMMSPTFMESIAQTLPRGIISPERVARLGVAACTRDPKLAECEPLTIMGSLLQCATLGLEPNTPLGHAWILPYYNGRTKRMEAQLIVGYQGMMELSRRSGQQASLRAHVVREGDDFDYSLGLDLTLHHRPAADRVAAAMTHVYAVAKLKEPGADPLIEVMSRAELEAHRDRFAPRNRDKRLVGPWASDFEAMCLKTVVRRLFKWLPKSTEAAQALALEQAGERGSQAQAWDSDVTNALTANFGLQAADHIAGAIDASAIEYDADTGEVTAPEPPKSAARKAVEKGEQLDDVAEAAELSGTMRDIYDLANDGKLKDAKALFKQDMSQLSPVQQTEIAGFLHAVEQSISKGAA